MKHGKKITDHEINYYINYLKERLIPDLRESGRDFTADDFQRAIDIIEQLRAP